MPDAAPEARVDTYDALADARYNPPAYHGAPPWAAPPRRDDLPPNVTLKECDGCGEEYPIFGGSCRTCPNCGTFNCTT